jgi:hypothetical protein
MGPARKIPASAKPQRSLRGAPDEIKPQPNAHIGANHVIGFKSSSTAAGAGVVAIRASLVMQEGYGLRSEASIHIDTYGGDTSLGKPLQKRFFGFR